MDDSAFFLEFRNSLRERLRTAQLTPRMLYFDMIMCSEWNPMTREENHYCWLPRDHSIAQLLVYNVEGLQTLHANLGGLEMIRLRRHDVDHAVRAAWLRFGELDQVGIIVDE